MANNNYETMDLQYRYSLLLPFIINQEGGTATPQPIDFQRSANNEFKLLIDEIPTIDGTERILSFSQRILSFFLTTGDKLGWENFISFKRTNHEQTVYDRLISVIEMIGLTQFNHFLSSKDSYQVTPATLREDFYLCLEKLLRAVRDSSGLLIQNYGNINTIPSIIYEREKAEDENQKVKTELSNIIAHLKQILIDYTIVTRNVSFFD